MTHEQHEPAPGAVYRQAFSQLEVKLPVGFGIRLLEGNWIIRDRVALVDYIEVYATGRAKSFLEDHDIQESARFSLNLYGLCDSIIMGRHWCYKLSFYMELADTHGHDYGFTLLDAQDFNESDEAMTELTRRYNQDAHRGARFEARRRRCLVLLNLLPRLAN